ncbi:hypothetical protein JCM30760_26220 [Thiomicrorhabdus hydrogeniphila]
MSEQEIAFEKAEAAYEDSVIDMLAGKVYEIHDVEVKLTDVERLIFSVALMGKNGYKRHFLVRGTDEKEIAQEINDASGIDRYEATEEVWIKMFKKINALATS